MAKGVVQPPLKGQKKKRFWAFGHGRTTPKGLSHLITPKGQKKKKKKEKKRKERIGFGLFGVVRLGGGFGHLLQLV
jgi:hypothetical protein